MHTLSGGTMEDKIWPWEVQNCLEFMHHHGSGCSLC